MTSWFKRLFRKQDNPFQATALNRLRGEQIKDDSIEGKHIKDRVISAMKFDTAFTAVIQELTRKKVQAKAYSTATQTVAINAWVKVLFNTIDYDTQSTFNIPSSRFIAPRKGVYLVNTTASWGAMATDNRYLLAIGLNGNISYRVFDEATPSAWGVAYRAAAHASSGSAIVNMEQGDYIEIFVYTMKEMNLALGTKETCFLEVIELDKGDE
jgi:hypothetical protein